MFKRRQRYISPLNGWRFADGSGSLRGAVADTEAIGWSLTIGTPLTGTGDAGRFGNLMTTLEEHLSPNIHWLARSEATEQAWEFGPGPPLLNLPSWVARFAAFDERVFMRAILSAAIASSRFWRVRPKTKLSSSQSGFVSPPSRARRKAGLVASSPEFVDRLPYLRPRLELASSESDFVERLPLVDAWIERSADVHPAWLASLGDRRLAMHRCDAKLFGKHWFSDPSSAANWANDSALHCLLTLSAMTRDHGNNRETYATMTVISAVNSFRCKVRKRRWSPAIASVLEAIRAGFQT